uniref:Uncharacterized protein n=1 Tax=Caenorhabditis tropicalis TaxID=1561998 RepID=A0A1I7UDH3_9PELO
MWNNEFQWESSFSDSRPPGGDDVFRDGFMIPCPLISKEKGETSTSFCSGVVNRLVESSGGGDVESKLLFGGGGGGGEDSRSNCFSGSFLRF